MQYMKNILTVLRKDFPLKSFKNIWRNFAETSVCFHLDVQILLPVTWSPHSSDCVALLLCCFVALLHCARLFCVSGLWRRWQRRDRFKFLHNFPRLDKRRRLHGGRWCWGGDTYRDYKTLSIKKKIRLKLFVGCRKRFKLDDKLQHFPCLDESWGVD